MAVTRHGQFFLLGALILASIMSGFVLFEKGGALIAPSVQPARGLFDQSINEFPRVVNTGVAENVSGEAVQRRLQSFLSFQSRVFESHALQHRAHAVVLIPSGTTVDVVVANARGVTMRDVEITVDGQQQTINELEEGTTALLTFTAVSDQFTVDLVATADRPINETFQASRFSSRGIHTLRVEGNRQVWQNTVVS